MKQSEAFFQAMPGFPALYLKHVYVEYLYPVLFSCYSEDDRLFLVSCHRSDGEQQEWVVTQTAPETLIEMLENKKTIRELFDELEKEKYLITLDSTGYYYRKCTLPEIPTEILPTARYYMEAEPDEFKEEIEELQELCKYRAFTVTQHSTWIPRTFRMNLQNEVSIWRSKLYPAMDDEFTFLPNSYRERVIPI